MLKANNSEKEAIFLQKDDFSAIYNKLLDTTDVFKVVKLSNFEDQIKSLQTQGIIILHGIYTDYISQYPIWREKIRSVLEGYKFEKSKVVYDNDRIAIMHDQGRIDFSNIQDLINFKILSEIEDVIDKVMKCRWECKTIGILTLDKQITSHGKWHRDTGQLFKYSEDLYQSDYMNLGVPDYYFTVFIPLTDIRTDNGPTEVILGSHKLSVNDARMMNRMYLLANCGDVIIMNGKLLHRGTPNFSDENRDVIYLVFAASWFDENH